MYIKLENTFHAENAVSAVVKSEVEIYFSNASLRHKER